MRFIILTIIISFTPLAYAENIALEALSQAQSDTEAQRLEEDVWASWLESDSAVTDVLMERAFDAERQGAFNIAEALYDRIIRINPNYAEAWHRRGLLNLRSERISEAILDFETALRHEPKHFAVWMALGQIFIQIEAYASAKYAFETSLAIHPYFAPSKFGLQQATKKTLGISL